MKRILLISILYLVITVSINAQQNESAIQERIKNVKKQLGDKLLTTADEVIARHVEAIGGKDAILSVKTMMFKGRFLRFGMDERILYRYYKQPNFIVASWSPDNTNYTFSDGNKVWSVTPDGRKEQDALWAVPFSHNRIDGNFIDYKNQGIKYEYVGLEGFESELYVYYHLRRTFPDGWVEDLYFDVETGLLHGVWKTVAPWENDPIFYYDYREVGGIRIPHIWVSVFENSHPPHVLVMEEVKINEDFGEEFFTEYKKKPLQK
jgi:hypothetical protein